MSDGYFKVHGCKHVSGQIDISGSKNACLQILAATLLTKDTCVIHNVPNLTDISFMIAIMRYLGVETERIGPNDWRFSAENLHGNIHDFARNFRASLCLAGPLLARNINIRLPLPGGCKLGARPIDIHINAFKAFGSDIHCNDKYIFSHYNKPLRGANVHLSGPRGASVTGTANAVMAAVLADGQSVLTGCARDPENLDLLNMLVKMGAKISGIGTDTLIIDGQPNLHGTEFTVQPDRIETGTFVILGLLLGENLQINNIRHEHLQNFLSIFNNTESIQILENSIIVNRNINFGTMNIQTGPHPNFPTDLQPQTAVLLSQLHGCSSVEDIIFPERFAYADELIKMHAKIEKSQGKIKIFGTSKLIGTQVKSHDLRAGAAMVLAGCIAENETIITNISHILRGYERLDKKLKNVGIDIEYFSGNSE